MIIFRIIYTTILTCLLLISPQISSANVQIYSLNQEYGLSIREVNSICADADGFIWASSKLGVIRYTKDDIRIYQLPFASVNTVSVELLYNSNTLWCYTNNGQLFKYCSIKDRFELMTDLAQKLDNLHVNVFNIISIDGKTLWLSTSYGLYSYSAHNGFVASTMNDEVEFIEFKDRFSFFYATAENIGIYNIVDNTYDIVYEKTNKLYVSTMWFDQRNKVLWIGTRENGLYSLSLNDSASLNHYSGIPKQPILDLKSVSDTTMLVGIDGQGVWEIKKEGQEIISKHQEDPDNPTSLKGNGVYDIFLDNNDRVWICTYTGGVSYFDRANSSVEIIKHIVNNQNSLVDNDVNSIYEDSKGNFWYATNSGISFYDVNTKQWKTIKKGRSFHTLCEDNKGQMWVGGYSSGIFKFDLHTQKEIKHYFQEENSDGANCGYVFDLCKDAKGNIWAGGVMGDLVCFLASNDSIISYGNVSITSLADVDDTHLLVGATFGLLLLNKQTKEYETLIKNSIVRDLYLSNNTVWVGTNGQGVFKYDLKARTEEVITTEQGLPSNFVNAINYADGYFWIGTELGLCRLRLEDKELVTYESTPELNNVSFNQAASCLLSNGRLALGTNKGVVEFEPREMKYHEEKGRIFIQDITISGKTIRETENIKLEQSPNDIKEITFKHYQNTIGLELISMDVSSYSPKLSWQLNGFDSNWSSPSDNRFISYSNLPSGDYCLNIRMYNNSLSDVIAERSLVFKIIPPIWKRWWFQSLAYFALFGSIILLFFGYINHLNKKHSEEKVKFFVNAAHDIRTTLSLIKGPIEEVSREKNLSKKTNRYLQLAKENVLRLNMVVSQLMDLQKSDIGKEHPTLKLLNIVQLIKQRISMFEALAEIKSITIDFKTAHSSLETMVDEQMIEKVIDNLISNAIKYSHHNSTVVIRFRQTDKKWILDIIDSGIGISKKAQKHLFKEYYRAENAINSKVVGSGIGLLIVKNYVCLHGGKVDFESQKDIGSTFSIAIPINTEAIANHQKEDVNDIEVMQNDNTTAPEECGQNQMSILVVDDHDSLRMFIKSALEDEFNIMLAEDGSKAWEIIQDSPPDIVVSDIMMPNMDGFELCEKLKSTYETSHIPIILLTALSGKAQQLKGLGLGADNYLVKPFDIPLLLERIRSIMKNRVLVREKAINFISENDQNNATPIVDNELNDDFLKKMMKVIHNNMDNAQFSKNEFAMEMHVSPSLLYKKVKFMTDLSPTEFMKKIRLERSVELLKSQKYTVTEVSEMCGFSSVAYFSTVFRKQYGKPPTQL